MVALQSGCISTACSSSICCVCVARRERRVLAEGHPPSRRVGWLLEQKVNAQVRLTRRIFHLAALHGAASVGIPGISTGARRFPKAAAAEIAAFVAVDEVVASGLTLDVHLISNDDRSDAGYMRGDFERAVEVALRSVGQREYSPGAVPCS